MSEKIIKVLLEIEIPADNAYYMEINAKDTIKNMFVHEHSVKVIDCHIIDEINFKTLIK